MFLCVLSVLSGLVDLRHWFWKIGMCWGLN